MLTLIPAIDLIDGKCVRLSKGDYTRKKIYNNDPLEVAKEFEAHGLSRLHLVDLDGAKEKHIVNWRILNKITTKTGLTVDFGGGIKSDEDMRIVFECGASMATVGSVAVQNKDLLLTWLNEYGFEKIILGADVNDRKIAVSGWMEVTEIDIFDFLDDYMQTGVKHVLCTDINKDGMLEGASVELYKDILGRFKQISLIASGGITEMKELYTLDEMGVSGVIIGKAIYEGKISLNDLQRFVGD